jgi:Flp pilus assembly protein TadD
MNIFARILVTLSMCLVPIGCVGGRRGPYASQSEAERSTVRAESLSHQATKLIRSDPAKAETLLREALTADLYYGPAHNNLGVLHLKAGRLYEAAGEFEWARKLMPGSPDPRTNLAMTLEKAGKVEDALAAYGAALELQEEHLPAVQGLTRLQLRSGRADERMRDRLALIALRGDEQWQNWARSRLAAMP